MAEELTLADLYQKLLLSQEENTKKVIKSIETNKAELEANLEITVKEVKKLQSRNINLERKIRKNNIIIFGIKINKENILPSTLETLNNLFQTNFIASDIKDVYFIGRTEEKQGVLVEFVTFFQKLNIYKNVQKLQGKNISVVNDLCPEDQESNKILIKHLKIARSQNKEARVKGFRLLVNGKYYTAEELEEAATDSTEYETDEEEEEEERELDTENSVKINLNRKRKNRDIISSSEKKEENEQRKKKNKENIGFSRSTRSTKKKF